VGRGWNLTAELMMFARFMAITCLSLAALACSDRNQITGLVQGQVYHVTRLNGQTLPAEISRFFDAQGQTCIERLTEGLLTFNGAGRFGLFLSNPVTCGTTQLPTDGDDSTGSFTQSGNTITFQTEQSGITAITTARLVGARLDMVGTRDSGVQLNLEFTLGLP
jgi:hypothetical protein